MARVIRTKKKPGPKPGNDPHKRAEERAAEGGAKPAPKKARRRCEALNKRGEACGAIPFRPGSLVDDTEVSGRWCRRHSVENGELPTEADLDTKRDEAWANGALKGRAKRVRPADLIAEMVEKNPLAFVRPHLKALGLEVTVDGDGAIESVKVSPTGGAKLYSTSDGYVYVSAHEDVEAQQKAAERLFDRGFGKAVQTNLLGGAAGAGPIEIDVPNTADRMREVAEVLKELENE